MQPNYIIRTNQQAFDTFIRIMGIDYEIEADFPLFEQKLLCIEPLQSPDGNIFHLSFKYGNKENNK